MLQPVKYFFNPFRTYVNRDEARGVTYCSFTQRMNATALDMLFLFFLLYPITYLLSLIVYGDNNFNAILLEIQSQYPPHTQPTKEEFKAILDRHQFIERFIINNLLGLVIFGIIYSYFWTKLGATPGKWLLGYKIVDAKTLGPISKKQSILRFIGCIMAGLPFLIGFFMVAFTKRNQGLHDLIAGTVVIETSPDFRIIDNIRLAWSKLMDKFKK